MSEYPETENMPFQVFLYPDQIQSLWDQVCECLKRQLNAGDFKSWIEPIKVVSYEDNDLKLGVSSRFVADRIEFQYGEQILKLCQEIFPYFNSCEYIIQKQEDINFETATPNKPQPSFNQGVKADPFNASSSILEEELEEEDYTSALDTRFTFDNFIMGKPNELAYAAALRTADGECPPPFNPLFLYGGVGLGKTHLMHAIAWKLKEKLPHKKVIYMSGEKFMYEFVRALRFKNTVAFKERFRNVDVLMIDDIQFIGGKDTTQEEFFHTFNALVDNNHQIIVSADKSPSDLEDMEERLKSRLGWGLVADIHPTTYELRLGILQAKIEAMKVSVPRDVIEFLASRIISNIRELEGALNRIVAHATLVGRTIDIDTTHEVLKDLLRSNDRRITTLEDIQKKVCEYYNLRISDMLSTRRSQSIARPRQLAMYLCKILTSKSLPEIGKAFGGRDHTTVIHSIKKIEETVAKDPLLSKDLEVLRRSLSL